MPHARVLTTSVSTRTMAMQSRSKGIHISYHHLPSGSASLLRHSESELPTIISYLRYYCHIKKRRNSVNATWSLSGQIRSRQTEVPLASVRRGNWIYVHNKHIVRNELHLLPKLWQLLRQPVSMPIASHLPSTSSRLFVGASSSRPPLYRSTACEATCTSHWD